MSLSPADVERLKDVVRQATVLVIVDDRPVGAAFFISDDLLLTCEHVVTQKTVKIKPNGRASRTADLVGTDGADLALLRSHQVDGEQPVCAVLDQTLHQGDSFVAGFPREDNVAPGSEIFDVQTYLRKDLEGGVQILQIEAGKVIRFGMSGGPVVSARSGAVIGIIRSSNDPFNALGGGAIPISRAAEAFEQVAEILPTSTLAMTSWRDALGRDNWQRLGKSWNLEQFIDLKVSGSRNRWLIGMDQAGPGLGLTGRDLGEEVSEAIYHWSRRRHARGTEELALLGRLLAGALFPQSIADRLDSVGKADSIFVRLHVERGNDVSEIPWELAAIPREKNRYLAADQKFRFARVVDKPAIATTPAAPKSPANVQVLAVVVRPKSWKYPEVHRSSGKAYEWPTADAIYDRLRVSIERQKFKVVRPQSLQPSDVRGALEDGARNGRPCDVLHYIGIGQRGGDGQAQIMFVDDEGDDSWEDARSILELAARTDVRLVVLELMQPPEGLDYDPLTHHALRDVVGGSVNDVVFTHLPVHPKQYQKFNDKFYEVLGSGESIETAVQLARNKLWDDKPMDDAAGFGWFTVVTGPQSGICLITLTPEDPVTGGGMPHIATADRAADVTGEGPGRADR